GDALALESLEEALEGVAVAYYLIHSMLLGRQDFASADRQAAANFRRAAEEHGVRRIIYLGGLGDIRSRLSDHLRSRMEVARELSSGGVPVTILRAAIIIGSGSASYEIIKDLVNKLPVIPIPPFARTRCQPISIRDVIKYLVGVMETPITSGLTFDIGGDEIMTYEEMAKVAAAVLHRRRLFLHVPLSYLELYAYLASLLTPVPASITRCLMEGLRNEVVCLDDSIRQYVPFETIDFRTAIIRALSREEQDRVRTRWSDAYPRAHELAMKLHELEAPPRYTARYSLVTERKESDLFRSICRIGGREGWFHSNWMWRVRGALDRILQGVGSARGRRQSAGLSVNDVIDFWRVEDIERNRRLLLRSEMKMPGKAWLEFTLEPARPERRGGVGEDGAPAKDAEGANTGPTRLSVTAYYDTAGLLGRLYWYIFLPFHHVIFKGLIRQIEERS
ncbi:MAG TPA: SDR family oxidoreductase, partial [Candidatus Eisenbacteria bacterium]|nr:SDR family oxidoreductase [Candidatus Eisenbacteria bacterium]